MGRDIPEISFCTTCANRAAQLFKVFDANAILVEQRLEIEWVILNFGSRDSLHASMMERLPRLSRRVVYFHHDLDRPWHSSIAKNAAHRLASGRILMNLDCDNFIGDAADVIAGYFGQGCRMLHLWSGVFNDGTYGRIAVRRELFEWLGGYDEDFEPMGYQDSDLLHRAEASGIPVLHARCGPHLAIRNTKEDSILHCESPGSTWRELNDRNAARSRANVTAGRLVANAGRAFGELSASEHRGGR